METTHRGVQWRKDDDGSLHFYDSDGGRWVAWAPGVDAPPLPPRWAPRRINRPGWRTKWRLVPVVVVVLAVVIAVVQVLHPAGNQTAKEMSAATALLGKCLAQHGTFEGHPKYSAKPVSCTSPEAAVKVVQVVPTSPGSAPCPTGTTPVILVSYDVKYPHLECIRPLHP